jgi:threonine dehydrogenase-like Zn-dependent dehydrogenase
VRAVRFDVSARGFVLARTLGRISDAPLYGGLSALALGEVDLPDLPGGRWVRLRVVSCGICGTDISSIGYALSPSIEPFSSFPAVLGHEILATVEAVGSEVSRVEPGQRVSVDPMIACTVRGFSSPCPSCSVGRHGTCEMAGEDGEVRVGQSPLSPGLTIGYHRDLPGGWGELVLAHEDQLFPVPEGLDDRTAVLTEPLSIGMHAVLNSGPLTTDQVLVIGSGPIALGTIWALRATGFDGSILAQIKRRHEAELATLFGASSVIQPGDPARSALVDSGARAYMPIIGEEVFAGGGFPLIFDCVGSRASLTQALRFASPRGTVVMLGCAAEIPKLDLTAIWSRELNLRGFVGYGLEDWRGERRHTFEVTHELMVETGTPLDRMVTHVYPLDEFRDGVRAAANRRRSGAVKVVLAP